MKKLLPLFLLLALLLCACGDKAQSAAPADDAGAESSAAAPAPAQTEESLDHTLIRFSGSEAEIRGGGARDEGASVTISAAGTYEVTGESDGKALIVDTGDDPMEVTVILNNARITNPTGPAIHVRQAKEFRLVLAAGSVNTLTSGEEAMLQTADSIHPVN